MKNVARLIAGMTAMIMACLTTASAALPLAAGAMDVYYALGFGVVFLFLVFIIPLGIYYGLLSVQHVLDRLMR